MEAPAGHKNGAGEDMMKKPQRAGQSAFLGVSLAALATAFGAMPAMAQDATAAQDDTTQEEEIVVTGFRASVAAAIDIKRNETAAVDAIVAEDIADFPDL